LDHPHFSLQLGFSAGLRAELAHEHCILDGECNWQRASAERATVSFLSRLHAVAAALQASWCAAGSSLLAARSCAARLDDQTLFCPVVLNAGFLSLCLPGHGEGNGELCIVICAKVRFFWLEFRLSCLLS